MTDTRRARLTAAGIDVDDALQRMMGSEALLERLLGKFPEDGNYAALRSGWPPGTWRRRPGRPTPSRASAATCP